MDHIAVTSEFGIVVRRAALTERGVSWEALLKVLEVQAPFDSNNDLISFGPHFGQEPLDVLIHRLSELGLNYFDDFFEFSGDSLKRSTIIISRMSLRSCGLLSQV
jgi:hypothetical protein